MSDAAFSRIKKGIQERADIAIERVQSFLDRRYRYTMSLEADPFGTNRIWFVKIRRESTYLMLSVIADANRVAAEQIMRHMAMMLLVMGFSVQPSSTNEFEFSREDFDQMREMEGFFLRSEFSISHTYDSKERLYSICLDNGEKRLQLLEVGGISERGISVLCKQIALILGGLGKHFVTADGTVGNKYGVVEFCPSEVAWKGKGGAPDNEDAPF